MKLALNYGADAFRCSACQGQISVASSTRERVRSRRGVGCERAEPAADVSGDRRRQVSSPRSSVAGGNRSKSLERGSGSIRVLAQDFRDFLALLANPGEELRQRLEIDAPLDTRALAPDHKPEGVPAATQEAFSQWVAGHALDANTAQTAATEVLRKTLHALARRMLEDGLSKVYKADSPHWSMSFRLTQVEDQWTVTYLDFGQWDAVPEKYGFAAILPELLPAMKTRKKSYELSIKEDGRVYADRGNQLELRP